MPSLMIVTPDGQRTPVTLSSDPITLGRAETCNYMLKGDAEVSREHVEIWLDEQERVVVTDKGSKNGTRVDEGEPFRNETRFAYRCIRIGEHDIRILGAQSSGGKTKPEVVFATDNTVRAGDTQYFPSSRGLDLSKQRLTLLIQLTERIGGVFERKQLLEEAVDVCCEALNFERGLIVLKTQRGDTELPVTRNVAKDETGAYKVSRTLINRALIHGERAIVNNPATDLVGNLSESLVRFPICSALCVPILNRQEILGVIYGDRITQASTYQPEDVDFLAAIAQQVGVGLANLRLFQAHMQSQRMYAELEQAREIQKRLLPNKPCVFGKLTIEGLNEPSSAVSGDYFDYFELGQGRWGVVIADVTGHGLAASLMMANLQSAVRVALTGEIALPEFGARMNDLICRNTASNVFITGIIGVLNTKTDTLEYINAGHPGPLVLHDGRVECREDDNSLPLGVEEKEQYATNHLTLPRGESGLLLYTDGLSEAANKSGAMMGVDPVVTALKKLPGCDAARIIRTARSAVNTHLDGAPRVDDMTLLAISYNTDASQ